MYNRKFLHVVSLFILICATVLVAQGQTDVTTITITDEVQLTETTRFGINLGARSAFEAGNYLKNLVTNPGFEATEQGMVFHVYADAEAVTLPSGQQGFKVQADFWDTAWNVDSIQIGHPVGFWDGGEYEVVTGNAKGSSGTIEQFKFEQDDQNVFRYTYYVTDGSALPAKGDILFVRAEIEGFYNDTQTHAVAEPSDTRPNSPGEQSLRLSPTDNYSASYSQGFDTYGRDLDTSADKLFIVDGQWNLSIWAKADGAEDRLRIQFQRIGESVFFDESIPLTDEWQLIERTFDVPDGADAQQDTPNAISFALYALDGELLVDDVTLERAEQTNPTVFNDKLVNLYKELQPGTIRNWGHQLGTTLDNQLSSEFARQPSGNNPKYRIGRNYHYSIHEFLQLCQEVEADPWYVIPPTFSAEDLTNFAHYLSSPVGSHPYADLRASLGQTAPWTDVFKTIHLEYGNEIWGSNASGDPFIGATMRGGVNAAQVGNDRFGIFKDTYSDTDKINFVLGGQARYAGRQQELEANGDNHTSIGIAPYYGDLTNATSDDAKFGALYAHSSWVTNDSYVTEGQAFVEEAGKGTDLAIYELNLHALSNFDISEEERNQFLTGLGGGISLPLEMFHYQADMGIRDILAYRTLQFSTPTSGQDSAGSNQTHYARVWGLLRDLEATGQKRPTWLGLEMANKVVMGDMITTIQTGANPSHIQPAMNGLTADTPTNYVQSYAYQDGDRYGLALFNVDINQPHAVQLQLPTESASNATLHILTNDDVYANNENGEEVVITSQPLSSFGNGYELTLDPHSMYVIEWDGTGAVNPPMETATPTVEPTATAIPSATSTPAPDVLPTSMPEPTPTQPPIGLPPLIVQGETYPVDADRNPVSGNVLDNDNGSGMWVRLITPPMHGEVSLGVWGDFTYTPTTTFTETDYFEYVVTDGFKEVSDVTTAEFAAENATPTTTGVGDINCDGTTNLIDIVLIKKYDAFLIPATNDCATVGANEQLYLPACDVDQDGKCGLVDAVIIQQCNAFIPNQYCSRLDS